MGEYLLYGEWAEIIAIEWKKEVLAEQFPTLHRFIHVGDIFAENMPWNLEQAREW